MTNAAVKWWNRTRAKKAAAKKAAAKELKAEARRQAAARTDFTAAQAKPASPAKKATPAKKAAAGKRAPARRAAQPTTQHSIFRGESAARPAATAPARSKAVACQGCSGTAPVVKDGRCGGCVIELSFPGTRSAMYDQVRDQGRGERLGLSSSTGRCGQSKSDGTLCQRPGICPRGTHPSRTDFGLPALAPAAPGQALSSLCACCGQRHGPGRPGEHCGSCTAHKAKPPTPAPTKKKAVRAAPGATRAARPVCTRCGQPNDIMQFGMCAVCEHVIQLRERGNDRARAEADAIDAAAKQFSQRLLVASVDGVSVHGVTAQELSTSHARAAKTAPVARAGRCGQATADGTPCQRKGTCPPGTHTTRGPANRKRTR